MSTQPLGITNFGAFTELTASKIAQAIAQQGFATTGKVFYCDPVNGLDANNGQQVVATPGQNGTGPVQTLGAGYALLTEGENDVLVLIGNGLSSGSARLHAAFTWAKDAAHLIGICSGSPFSQRARIAPGTTDTAFANFFTVSGNGCYFSNLQFFQGFATAIAAEICMTVSGQRNVFNNCSISGMGDTGSGLGANSTTSRNLLLQAGENLFVNCTIGLDTVQRNAANASVEITGNSARNVFKDCLFPSYLGSSGTGALGLKTAAASALDRFTLFDGCIFVNAINSGGSTMTALITLAAASGGMIVMKSCMTVGITTISTDSTTNGQVWIVGPTPNAGAFLATAATS